MLAHFVASRISDFQSLDGSELSLSANLDSLAGANKRLTIPTGPDKHLEIQLARNSVGLLSQISDAEGNSVSSMEHYSKAFLPEPTLEHLQQLVNSSRLMKEALSQNPAVDAQNKDAWLK
jgi:hypothetical protein